MRAFVFITLGIGLAGCVTLPQYLWIKNGGTQEEFSSTKYECMQASQQRVSGAYVNQYSGQAQDTVITNPNLFAACMNAHGWYWRAVPPGTVVYQ